MSFSAKDIGISAFNPRIRARGSVFARFKKFGEDFIVREVPPDRARAARPREVPPDLREVPPEDHEGRTSASCRPTTVEPVSFGGGPVPRTDPRIFQPFRPAPPRPAPPNADNREEKSPEEHAELENARRTFGAATTGPSTSPSGPRPTSSRRHEEHLLPNVDGTTARQGKLPRFWRFLVSKQHRSTPEAVDVISRKLGVDRERISFAGMKDKRGITSQYMTVRQARDVRYSCNRVKVAFPWQWVHESCWDQAGGRGGRRRRGAWRGGGGD